MDKMLYIDFVNVDKNGITVKDGDADIHISFDECAKNYCIEKSLESSKCVATRDITTRSFTFYTQPKTIIVFKKNYLKTFFGGKSSLTKFLDLEKDIIRRGYRSFDLS